MTNIIEDHVSFETAKLLKEKGFDVYCPKSYERCFDHKFEETSMSDWGKLNQYFAPTQQKAMKWLREVHKLWIGFSVFCPAPENMTKHADCVPKYFYNIKRYEIGYMDILTEREYELNFATYEECVEAAIKYCLENLI